MREAKVQDYWKKVNHQQFTDGLCEIDFQFLNHLPPLDITNGFLVLCGLNGAGKSTIISAIKDIVGIPLSEQDCYKLNGNSINGKALITGIEHICSNKNGKRLVDCGWAREKLMYIDSSDSVSVQKYIVSQTNFDELLEQFEEYYLQDKDRDDINYLVGKKYSSCSIRELDDVKGDGSVLPYFTVEVDSEKYDSKSMGVGEHFLLYLFWRIKQMEKGTLLIIEEPETFISITSQIHFANFIGKQMADKGIKVIITTHSPYILSNIRNEYVRIVSRLGNNVSITTPGDDISAESILGIEKRYMGTFFVEDEVAAEFLTVILEDRYPDLLRLFTIEQVGGHGEITKRLSFPYSDKIKYKFVGIYDGDMRDTLNELEIKWKYCFLPGEKAIEEVFRDSIHQQNILETFCGLIGKDKGNVIAILSTIDGDDHHDWLINFRTKLATNTKSLVSAFYQAIYKNDESIDPFLDELKAAIQ